MRISINLLVIDQDDLIRILTRHIDREVLSHTLVKIMDDIEFHQNKRYADKICLELDYGNTKEPE